MNDLEVKLLLMQSVCSPRKYSKAVDEQVFCVV